MGNRSLRDVESVRPLLSARMENVALAALTVEGPKSVNTAA